MSSFKHLLYLSMVTAVSLLATACVSVDEPDDDDDDDDDDRRQTTTTTTQETRVLRY